MLWIVVVGWNIIVVARGGVTEVLSKEGGRGLGVGFLVGESMQCAAVRQRWAERREWDIGASYTCTTVDGAGIVGMW
jgi:hypothetical protein